MLGLGETTGPGMAERWFRPQAAVLESFEHLIAKWDSGMNTFPGGEALEEEFFYPWPFPPGFGCCLTRNTPT